MENQQRQQVKKYLDLLFFHWKLLAACLLIATTGGLLLYLGMPKLYRCDSLLSYERQQINPARMAPEQDNQRLRDTISTLSDVVISRNNLEGIIKQFDLYHEARQHLPVEDVIDGMRDHIQITPSKRGDTFTVSFEGEDQDKVMKVTNALASKFIEENLKYRASRATETSRYTQDELDLAKTVLDKKEQLMRDYKLQHYNEMPEQRTSNLSRLNSLHVQYQGVQDSIQDLERTKVMAQEQINLRKRLLREMASGAATAEMGAGEVTGRGEPLSPWQHLQQLRSHLETLQLKYTDKHPEIRRTKKLIANLEADLDGAAAQPVSSTGSQRAQNPEIAQLQLQLKDISFNIKRLQEDQVTIRSEIEQYEQWITAAPVREAEWNALTRDYDELRRHYDYLVSQNLQASSVEHLERKQKGSKFKIVDSASFPDKPYKPNFLKLIFISLAAGLGVGAILVLVRDFVDTTFKDAQEIERYLDLSVVSSIPYLDKQNEVGAKRLKTVLWSVGFLLYFAALLSALVLFWMQGKIIL